MRNIVVCVILFLGLLPSPVFSDEQQVPIVAVAANFMGSMEKFVERYEDQTGRNLQVVYSSTGKLYAQMKKGAPYDVFLSADGERPELLYQEGLCEAPFTYAVGEAVLWSKNRSLAVETFWKDVVARGDVEKIAIPTPQTAPYGYVAMEAFTSMELHRSIQNKLVYGQNVAQAFQFAFHGGTDGAFTSLSFALSDKGKQGIYWQIPEAGPVVQKGCVLSGSAEKTAAADFIEFLLHEENKSILNKFGYK